MQNRELEITNRIKDSNLASGLIQFIRETNLSNDDFYKLLDFIEYSADQPIKYLKNKIGNLERELY